MASEKTPKKIIPGSELHFDIMGARYGFNLLVGSDRKSMQAFARNVWDAALAFRAGKAESLEWVGANSPLHQTLCMRPDPCSECERIEARATPPAATPAAPGEVTDMQSLLHCLRNALELDDRHNRGLGSWEQWIEKIDAALSYPVPVAAPASIPQAIDQLVSALAESKGWMRDYARALIEDAIDRRHLEVAAPAPASEAVAEEGLTSKQAWWAGARAGLGLPANTPRAVVAQRLPSSTGDSVDAPVQQAGEITDAMIDAYLAAQRQTVEEADKFGRPNVGGLHTNTVREACRNGLRAALKGEQPAQPSGSERGEV